MKVELSHENVDVQILPFVLQELVDVIGVGAALTIVKHYGGVRLYVPQTMKPEHILSRLIGFESALKLAAEYGAQTHFDIPRAVAAMHAVKAAEIAGKKRKGKTRRQLAYEYSMTERGIDKAAKRANIGPDDSQPSLF